MNTLIRLATATFFTISFISSSIAAERGTKPEAVALVQKAVAYFKANGKEKTIADINDKSGRFVDRDMYVFVINDGGVMLAHGMLAHGPSGKMLGKDMTLLKDADGKRFISELVNIIKSGKPGWVEYKWPNPVTQQIESKATYIEPVGDLGFAVGIYMP